MDTESLKTFVAIAEKESFSIAAEILHLTQPAVSKRIFSLESELGVQLFDRIGRHVQLTEAGQLFHRQAKTVLQQLNEIAVQIDNLSKSVAGTLRLGTSHHIGLHHLPPVLRHFNKQYPQVELELAFMDSESASAHVLRGEIDLAVITLPNQLHEMLHATPLLTDKLQVVIANDHPQASKLIDSNTSVITKLQTLQTIAAILPKRGTYTRNIIENEFHKYKLNFQDQFTTNFLETIKMMVKAGLGWSVLPQTMLEKNLEIIDLGDFEITRQLGIVRHEKRTLSNAAKKMIDVVIEMSTEQN